MCLGLSWVSAKKRNQYDKYLDVRGFDECELHATRRAAWEDDYPTRGVNFKMWNQISKKGDTSCVGGIYVEKTNMCFTYEVMK
jgi:hypothetical protein